MNHFILGVIGVSFAASLCMAQQAIFRGVGDLPGGDMESRVNGVSADGRVLVGRCKSADGPLGEAFRWTLENGMVPLDRAPGGPRFGEAMAASADGRVIVGHMFMPETFRAVRWVDGAIQLLGDLQGASMFGAAKSVSADGEVVVGVASSPFGNQAFRWTPATGMVGLGDLPGGLFYSDACSVSADGTIVVGESDSTLSSPGNFKEAMCWEASVGMTPLGDLGGSHSYFGSIANAISADGLTTVGHGHDFGSYFLTRWTASRGIHLVWPASPFSHGQNALAVSGDGTVIVGRGWTERREYAAFVWSPYAERMRELRDVMRTHFGLDPKGWVLTEATGVSADGTVIVGNGLNPEGYPEGWMVYLPQPCRADVNRDGQVDGADAMGFIDAIRNQNVTDFNGDLTINSSDFFAFLDIFFSGCD